MYSTPQTRCFHPWPLSRQIFMESFDNEAPTPPEEGEALDEDDMPPDDAFLDQDDLDGENSDDYQEDGMRRTGAETGGRRTSNETELFSANGDE